jgi:uncharacterized protein YbjT (DUF2867 family)
MGQKDNPNYKFLNVFGGVLDHKLAAEKYLRASGLDWTVVRPGGLSSDAPEKVRRRRGGGRGRAGGRQHLPLAAWARAWSSARVLPPLAAP